MPDFPLQIGRSQRIQLGLKFLSIAGIAWILGNVPVTAEDLRDLKPKVAQAREGAIDFLKTTQREDGSWTSPTSPGISGLVTTGLLRAGLKPSDPVAKKALQHLSTFVQADGGIYEANSAHRNYETSICISDEKQPTILF